VFSCVMQDTNLGALVSWMLSDIVILDNYFAATIVSGHYCSSEIMKRHTCYHFDLAVHVVFVVRETVCNDHLL
jgi:hypothetical protein